MEWVAFEDNVERPAKNLSEAAFSSLEIGLLFPELSRQQALGAQDPHPYIKTGMALSITRLRS